MTNVVRSKLKAWQSPAEEETGNRHIKIERARKQHMMLSDVRMWIGAAWAESDRGEQNWHEGAMWRYKIANADEWIDLAYEKLRNYVEGVKRLEKFRHDQAVYHRERRAKESLGVHNGN
jgi:hypothetical protein